MERLKYPLDHEWHVAINKFSSESGKHEHFMYEAKTMADEIPRMVKLFEMERTDSLPKTHQQCSQSQPMPVPDNYLTCCLGTKTKECPYLSALESTERAKPEDIDTIKAWTCAAHIVSKGGDMLREGYLIRVDDRIYWDNVYNNLAMGDEDG